MECPDISFEKVADYRANYPKIDSEKIILEFDKDTNSVLWHYVDKPASSRVLFNAN